MTYGIVWKKKTPSLLSCHRIKLPYWGRLNKLNELIPVYVTCLLTKVYKFIHQVS